MNRFKRRALARWVMAAAYGVCASSAMPVMAGAAAGNLKVEWRVVSSAQAQARQAGVGSGGVSVSTSDMNQRQDSIHSLLVLNGSRARLYVGRTVPQTTWQFAFSPSHGGTGGGQVQLQSQTTWIDLGQGLTVRPRWRGGAAPVEVEIEAQSRNHVGVMTGANGIAPDGQTQRQEVMSTLAIPLGQWVVVAQSRGNQAQQARGSWSTTTLDSTGGEQLELRVTQP